MTPTTLPAELQYLALINRHAAQARPEGALIDDGIIHTLIAANVAGDNVLIPAAGRTVYVLEIQLWNGAGAQTLILKSGALPLNKFTAAPQGFGWGLEFTATGNAHFIVASGNALYLNLSIGSLVEGFIKYRTA
jgi:hypothetical protein